MEWTGGCLCGHHETPQQFPFQSNSTVLGSPLEPGKSINNAVSIVSRTPAIWPHEPLLVTGEHPKGFFVGFYPAIIAIRHELIRVNKLF